VVSKTAAPDPVVAGQNLTYVITVDNVGPAAATNVVVSDTLGSLVNTGGFQSAVASQGSCTPNAVTNGTSQNLSCNLGTLNSGAQATVTVVVRPSIAVSGPRTNTATVRSTDVGDPNQANNSGSVTSQVTAIVDVTAAKTATPSTVAAGAPITFVATIGNTGPSTAQTVQMVDTLPSNAALGQHQFRHAADGELPHAPSGQCNGQHGGQQCGCDHGNRRVEHRQQQRHHQHPGHCRAAGHPGEQGGQL
jgi:uncharacterized repeat protein (TIGR01451 family)